MWRFHYSSSDLQAYKKGGNPAFSKIHFQISGEEFKSVCIKLSPRFMFRLLTLLMLLRASGVQSFRIVAMGATPQLGAQ